MESPLSVLYLAGIGGLHPQSPFLSVRSLAWLAALRADTRLISGQLATRLCPLRREQKLQRQRKTGSQTCWDVLKT